MSPQKEPVDVGRPFWQSSCPEAEEAAVVACGTCTAGGACGGGGGGVGAGAWTGLLLLVVVLAEAGVSCDVGFRAEDFFFLAMFAVSIDVRF